jgi:hypothetical protein
MLLVQHACSLVGSNTGIFSHVLDTHYGSPEINYKGTNFHFDWEVFGECSMQYAVCYGECSMQYAVCYGECSMQYAVCYGECSMQYAMVSAVCSMLW